MKKEVELIACYKQRGANEYPEDTWGREKIVADKNDTFRFMKSCFKDSANSFNNYPFSGLFHCGRINFKKRSVITDDDGIKYYSESVACEFPEFYAELCIKFGKWYSRMEHLLPYWKKRREDKQKEVNELAQLAELKSKYEK